MKELEKIMIEMYPKDDGDCNHYENGGECICRPLVYFDNFAPIRHHFYMNIKVKQNERPREIPIDWN